MKANDISTTIPPLYCLHYNECDPKKCTALKLKKLNLLNIVPKIKGKLTKAIVLQPFSRKVISINDRERILKFGLIVIDCSWNRLLSDNKLNVESGRKLPPLIAVNPINYGKWEKLSSVEALAETLYIINFCDLADLILSKFSWGYLFKELNKF